MRLNGSGDTKSRPAADGGLVWQPAVPHLAAMMSLLTSTPCAHGNTMAGSVKRAGSRILPSQPSQSGEISAQTKRAAGKRYFIFVSESRQSAHERRIAKAREVHAELVQHRHENAVVRVVAAASIVEVATLGVFAP